MIQNSNPRFWKSSLAIERSSAATFKLHFCLGLALLLLVVGCEMRCLDLHLGWIPLLAQKRMLEWVRCRGRRPSGRPPHRGFKDPPGSETEERILCGSQLGSCLLQIPIAFDRSVLVLRFVRRFKGLRPTSHDRGPIQMSICRTALHQRHVHPIWLPFRLVHGVLVQLPSDPLHERWPPRVSGTKDASRSSPACL